MGGNSSKNHSGGGGDVAMEANEKPSSSSSTPVRPASLSPSKSPSPNRQEISAIKIPEASKDLAVPCDPRSPTNEMSRTPMVEAAPFVDPRSPDNNILRTPLDKTSGFKGFTLDDSLPYIDESQESSKPTSSPPELSISPLNLDISEDDEFGGGGGGVGGGRGRGGSDDDDDDVTTDTSVELSPRNSDGAVQEFDAVIGDELEKENAIGNAAVTSDGAASMTSNGAASMTSNGAGGMTSSSFVRDSNANLSTLQQRRHLTNQSSARQLFVPDSSPSAFVIPTLGSKTLSSSQL